MPYPNYGITQVKPGVYVLTQGAPSSSSADYAQWAATRGWAGFAFKVGDSTGPVEHGPDARYDQRQVARLYKLVWPCIGPITSTFNPSHTPGGVDIGVATGTPVVAAHTGTVTSAGYDSNSDPAKDCTLGNSGYGNYVVVQGTEEGEADMSTLYGHLSAISVGVGDTVTYGQQIGLSGCTGKSSGPHLHFELRFGSQQADPLLNMPRPVDNGIAWAQKFLAEGADTLRDAGLVVGAWAVSGTWGFLDPGGDTQGWLDLIAKLTPDFFSFEFGRVYQTSRSKDGVSHTELFGFPAGSTDIAHLCREPNIWGECGYGDVTELHYLNALMYGAANRVLPLYCIGDPFKPLGRPSPYVPPAPPESARWALHTPYMWNQSTLPFSGAWLKFAGSSEGGPVTEGAARLDVEKAVEVACDEFQSWAGETPANTWARVHEQIWVAPVAKQYLDESCVPGGALAALGDQAVNQHQFAGVALCYLEDLVECGSVGAGDDLTPERTPRNFIEVTFDPAWTVAAVRGTTWGPITVDIVRRDDPAGTPAIPGRLVVKVSLPINSQLPPGDFHFEGDTCTLLGGGVPATPDAYFAWAHRVYMYTPFKLSFYVHPDAPPGGYGITLQADVRSSCGILPTVYWSTRAIDFPIIVLDQPTLAENPIQYPVWGTPAGSPWPPFPYHDPAADEQPWPQFEFHYLFGSGLSPGRDYVPPEDPITHALLSPWPPMTGSPWIPPPTPLPPPPVTDPQLCGVSTTIGEYSLDNAVLNALWGAANGDRWFMAMLVVIVSHESGGEPGARNCRLHECIQEANVCDTYAEVVLSAATIGTAYGQVNCEDSVGLFQLNRNGGVGDGYLVSALKGIGTNVAIACARLWPEWNVSTASGAARAVNTAVFTGWLADAWALQDTYDATYAALLNVEFPRPC